MNLTNIGQIKDICKRHNFEFSKSLGQNFLINPSVCPKIAQMGGCDGNVGVIEIGTGFGVLTCELAKLAKKVVAIELDSRLLPVLDETLADFDNVKIINEDVLKVDLKALIEQEFAGMEVVVCANLPYYITSPIIMSLLEQRLPIKAITVMVQKEAADRICAKLGTRDCGAVTVAVRYFSDPKILFNVSRGSFMPSPNVDSCVIKLDVKEQTPPDVKDEKFFFKVVKACFSQRRKTIVNSICNNIGISKSDLISILENLSLSPTIRAEQLVMQNFIDISNAILEIKE
ncbi:MAG: 16S rRNA (adenine(1518)-N(6)/adenine(1519)-N(6))-dimethyltransferase RsmA [Oscillospiraceae bacterium]|nr:16S rRNA (adenine(1518)-N(6)/adenine(1519)-N(6))-dimethyltransferase RsmA [Oscillospiraceae bacterium]